MTDPDPPEPKPPDRDDEIRRRLENVRQILASAQAQIADLERKYAPAHRDPEKGP